MNIFIMVLAALFVTGYYFMDSPSQRVTEQELEHAINRSDMRSIAECTATAHTAAIRGMVLTDECVQRYELISNVVCMNEQYDITKCEIIKNKKPEFSFIITSTIALPIKDYNNMLEVLEKHYPNSGAFGVFIDDVILAGGNTGKRTVPKNIIKAAELTNGQLVYMTQYELPDIEINYTAPNTPDIKCPAGTIKTYRFARWQCIPQNTKTNCIGDKIWDNDMQDCVPDNSRRPLCASKQTAVMVEDIWECIDPFLERTCPAGMIAKLNYTNMEWECIQDPSLIKDTKRCANAQSGVVYGTMGATLRIASTSCTDCEQMVTDPDTCITVCIPDPSKLNDPKCYPDTRNCIGPNRAFYFGFPGNRYALNVSAVAGRRVPLDAQHSQNRKFNCLDCGAGRIDTENSTPPFIAVCE